MIVVCPHLPIVVRKIGVHLQLSYRWMSVRPEAGAHERFECSDAGDLGGEWWRLAPDTAGAENNMALDGGCAFLGAGVLAADVDALRVLEKVCTKRSEDDEAMWKADMKSFDRLVENRDTRTEFDIDFLAGQRERCVVRGAC